MADIIQNQNNNYPNSNYSIEAAKHLMSVINALQKANDKSQKALNAIASNDRNVMWRTLQEYINEYAGLINRSSVVTGNYIIRGVNPDMYSNCCLVNQLQFIIKIVYLDEALKYSADEGIKYGVKQLLKSTGMFTDEDLAWL